MEDYFTMKRNKLQRLCKKHGIPANLKNREMAERLSLIDKGKENENPVPRPLRTYKDKSNVEIIILDSDSDTDVPMEAPGIVSVAEKDSNEMNHVNVEHILDEVHSSGFKDSVREPDQFLATSPLSEVKSSDLNIHRPVDSDNTVAEKDSNEKTNVDELHSSGLKSSVGEPDQCLVTLPLIGVKSSDLNIDHMVDSGTAGGNADVSEVKSASSQQQGQEESQMTLEGEKSEDNVRFVHLEENKQMSVIKDKIEDNQEFYQPTPTDLNVHQMVDSGTADGHVDACEESKMKFTPERSYNVATFYAEDNMQMSVNVLEQFGNYMMMGEDLYGTPVRDTCEEGLLRLSEKKFMVADPEECIGFSLNELEASTSKGSEPETSFDQTTVGGVMETYNRKESMEVTTKGSEAEIYFDQTTHGDVMKTYNRKESMQVDNMETEHNQEFFDNSDVFEKDCKEKTDVATEHFLDEVHSTGLKYSVGKPDHFLATSLSETNCSDSDTVAEKDSNEKTNVDSGAVAGNADACEVRSASLQQMSEVQEESKMKLQCERSENNAGSFYPEENTQMSVNTEHIEGNQELSPITPTDLDVLHMVDSDTCEEEMQDLSEKDKTCMVADLEAFIGFPPNDLEAATTKGSEADTDFDQTILGNVVLETCRIDKVEKENNQDDCFLAQREVGKFFDNDDFGADGLVQTVPQPSETESFNFSLQQTNAFNSGAVAGNADACEVRSASLQQMREVQEESKMKLQCERGENNAGSFYPEENTQMSVNTEHIEGNQKLSPATPTDLDVLHMVDSGTAAGDVEGCEVKSASLQCREEAKNKLIPESSDQELHQAAPTASQPSETMSFNFSLQQLFTLDTCEEEMQDLSEKDKTCMVADLEAFIGFPPNDLEAATTKGSEADTDFDQTILGNVVLETCRIDKVEKENNQDDCFLAQGEVGKFFDNDDFGADGLVQTVPQPSETESFNFSLQQTNAFNSGAVAGNADACEVRSASLQQMSEVQEESKMKLQCERSENNAGSFYPEVNTQMSVNTEHIEGNQELSPITPTDLDVLHMVDSGAVAGNADACEVRSASLQQMSEVQEESKMKLQCERSGNNAGSFYPEENTQMSVNTEHIEGYQELSPITPTDLDVLHMVDSGTASGDADGCEVKPASLQCRAEAKNTLTPESSDQELHQAAPTVSQPSETMSCNFSLQQLFALDTCEEEMQDLSEKDKTCMVADLEACIGFPPNDLEAATVKGSEADTDFDPTILGNVVMETCRIDKVEENNQVDFFSAKGEVCKFFDNDDFGADELVQTVPQPSEMESFNLSLQQLFASDTASGDEDAVQEKLDSPSKATPTASGEKNIVFSPKLHESNTEQIEDNKELSPAPSEENLELHPAAPCEDVNVLEEYGNYMMVREDSDGVPVQLLPTSDHNILKMVVRDTCEEEMMKLSEKSDVYDDIGGVGEDENQPPLTNRKRKNSDEDDTCTNSDEDLKADELVPTEPQPSEMESYTSSLQQIFASDTASGDEEAYKEKFISPSRATPIQSGEKSSVFSPKPHESSMRHKEMDIEMSFPLKRARDSIGTRDMKENIKIDKEEVGSIIPKTKFAKRQPLQDLQQN